MVFMMFAIPYFANQSFIVDYIAARHLAVSSDLFFVFYAAALLTMRITMKDLFDSKGFKFWLTICSIAMLSMLTFLAFMTNDWYLFGAGVAMAASYGLMSSVTQAQAVVIAGRERSGLANSTYYMGLDLGMALGPILAGIFYGHMPISWFYPAFMLTMPRVDHRIWCLHASSIPPLARMLDGDMMPVYSLDGVPEWQNVVSNPDMPA